MHLNLLDDKSLTIVANENGFFTDKSIRAFRVGDLLRL